MTHGSRFSLLPEQSQAPTRQSPPCLCPADFIHALPQSYKCWNLSLPVLPTIDPPHVYCSSSPLSSLFPASRRGGHPTWWTATSNSSRLFFLGPMSPSSPPGTWSAGWPLSATLSCVYVQLLSGLCALGAGTLFPASLSSVAQSWYSMKVCGNNGWLDGWVDGRVGRWWMTDEFLPCSKSGPRICRLFSKTGCHKIPGDDGKKEWMVSILCPLQILKRPTRDSSGIHL